MCKKWSAIGLVPAALAFLALAAVWPALTLAAEKPAGGGVKDPVNVTVSPLGSTAKLQWTAPNTSVGGYKVAYSVDPAIPLLSAAVNVGNVTSYTIFGLAPATRYNFKVWSWTKDKKGNESTSSGVQVSCTTPPVFYDLHWLDTLGRTDGQMEQMNNWGEVVGYVFDRNWNDDGSLYRTNRGAFYFNGVDSIDLNTLMGPALAGKWIATYAYSINDSGQIAGSLRATDSEAQQGFVYDTSTGTTILLPPPPLGGTQWSQKINVRGDVVAAESVGGTYYITMYYPNRDGAGNIFEYVPGPSWEVPNSYPRVINASGQILLNNAMRYTPDVGWQDFKLTLNAVSGCDMNELGTFVGTRGVGSKSFAYRFEDPASVQDFAPDSLAAAVNLQGDVCFSLGHRGYVYYSDLSGWWALDNAVPIDETWQAAGLTWIKDMTDRSGTTAGAICGDVIFGTNVTTLSKPFLLTPQ